MSAEDFISKLFKENEHKLDEMPGDEIWNKIQNRLQSTTESSQEEKVDMPSKLPKQGKPIRFYLSLAVAATLLIALITIAFIMFPKTEEIVQNLPLTKDKAPESEQPTPVNEAEKDSMFKMNDSRQEQKIIEEALNKNNTTNKENKPVLKIENVKIAEKKSEIIVPINQDKPVEIISEIVLPNRDNNSTAKGTQFNEKSISNRNYAIPPSADLTLADEIEIIANEAQNNSRNRKENSNNSVLNSKRTVQKNQKIQLNKGLKIFEWMLGQWIDEEEDGGSSYENWDITNNNSITALGFKMKGKNKIFEEKVHIQFDPSINQVFLKMPLNESSQIFTYVMTSFDNERIIFDQREYSDMPDRVIIQRNLKGYSFIILYNNGFIKPAQQTYLEHRNRVSNVRAIRIFKPYSK